MYQDDVPKKIHENVVIDIPQDVPQGGLVDVPTGIEKVVMELKMIEGNGKVAKVAVGVAGEVPAVFPNKVHEDILVNVTDISTRIYKDVEERLDVDVPKFGKDVPREGEVED